jgi:hypothetical protein
MATLPPGCRTEPGHQARWPWRTLHAAELAGLDPGRVLAEAVGERDLVGARDVAAVIDARLRYRLGTPVPLPAAPWSAQVPQIADSGRRAYIGQIAALMDARKGRIGEHAAEHAPPWAVTALGPVPAHPLDRLDWQRRAASIGAWRELSGYQHPADPIGPEPVAAAPELARCDGATRRVIFVALQTLRGQRESFFRDNRRHRNLDPLGPGPLVAGAITR